MGVDTRGVDTRGRHREPQPAREFRQSRHGRPRLRQLRVPFVHLATSNPFERIFPVPADGRDLNPVLQDPALAIHPPMLYMGYVGMSVAFAFACAAMLEGKLDQTWARWTRPWTTTAWAFLGVGIALGSWWAYYELGWGGYWFWDPVENASFMPWLVATALIHSLAATEKRGVFKSWTLLLAILAFSLSLLGTFLVRSGVLTSVHSFAADPTRGLFILGFLIIVVGGALALYAWRAPLLRSPAGFEGTAREAFLLYNNIFLVVAAAMVLVGTLAPLIADALGAAPLSVGSPYFDKLFPMLMLPLGALVSIGIHAAWKRGQLRTSRARILSGLALRCWSAWCWSTASTAPASRSRRSVWCSASGSSCRRCSTPSIACGESFRYRAPSSA